MQKSINISSLDFGQPHRACLRGTSQDSMKTIKQQSTDHRPTDRLLRPKVAQRHFVADTHVARRLHIRDFRTSIPTAIIYSTTETHSFDFYTQTMVGQCPYGYHIVYTTVSYTTYVYYLVYIWLVNSKMYNMLLNCPRETLYTSQANIVSFFQKTFTYRYLTVQRLSNDFRR